MNEQPVPLSSPETKELLSAFVKFFGDNTNVEKNKTNPHFRANYADLAEAIQSSRQHLKAYGLAVMQFPFTDGDLVGVRTMIAHDSGQWISSVLTMRPTRHDPQAVGSAITYARRYSYMAILGMAGEDDDGNAASSRQNQGPAATPSSGPKIEPKKEQPKLENFDQSNLDHLERLENKLSQMPGIPVSKYEPIAAALHGKPMTSGNVKEAIDSVFVEGME